MTTLAFSGPLPASSQIKSPADYFTKSTTMEKLRNAIKKHVVERYPKMRKGRVEIQWAVENQIPTKDFDVSVSGTFHVVVTVPRNRLCCIVDDDEVDGGKGTFVFGKRQNNVLLRAVLHEAVVQNRKEIDVVEMSC